MSLYLSAMTVIIVSSMIQNFFFLPKPLFRFLATEFPISFLEALSSVDNVALISPAWVRQKGYGVWTGNKFLPLAGTK